MLNGDEVWSLAGLGRKRASAVFRGNGHSSAKAAAKANRRRAIEKKTKKQQRRRK